jgi:hypothetical protein
MVFANPEVGSNAFAWAIDAVPLMSSYSETPNRVWVGTFQLVWNDFMDGIVKGPVQFKGRKSKLAQALNKRDFTENELSPGSYYKTYGEISLELKQQIETAIKKKFNETSDVLDTIYWLPGEGKYLVYAMLKKDFKFAVPFDKLGAVKGINYFGITPKSSNVLRDQVTVLFYNSRVDYAVKIRTAGADEIYLYRTDEDENFEKLYNKMLTTRYDGYKGFLPKDELKVPDLNLFVMQSFDELCNRPIKGTNGLMISNAIETVDFKMNNTGVKLKSEAAIATTKSAVLPQNLKPRLFYFNDTFVIFLQERGKEKPYFALRVADAALINKTGRGGK